MTTNRNDLEDKKSSNNTPVGSDGIIISSNIEEKSNYGADSSKPLEIFQTTIKRTKKTKKPDSNSKDNNNNKDANVKSSISEVANVKTNNEENAKDKEELLLREAKTSVLAKINKAIELYGNFNRKDDVKIINKQFFDTTMGDKERVYKFLSYSLKGIEEKIEATLDELSPFFNFSGLDPAKLRSQLLELTKNKILEVRDGKFFFTPPLKKIEEKYPSLSIKITDFDNVIEQKNRETGKQSRANHIIKKINENLKNLINDIKNDFGIQLKQSESDKLISGLNLLVAEEIKEDTKKGPQAQDDINCLKFFDNEKNLGNIAKYIVQVQVREILATNLQRNFNVNYSTKTKDYTSNNFTVSSFKYAATNPVIIEDIQSDINDLNNLIEIQQLKSFVSEPNSPIKKNNILTQLVIIENNENGYFAQLYKDISNLDLDNYRKNKNRFTNLLHGKHEPFDKNAIERIIKLFNRYDKLIANLSSLKKSLTDTNLEISNYIKKIENKSNDDDFDLQNELSKVCRLEAAENKLKEIDNEIENLKSAHELLLNSDENNSGKKVSENNIDKLEQFISTSEEKTKAFEQHDEAQKRIQAKIDETKKNIEYVNSVKDNMGLNKLELIEEIPLENEFKLNPEHELALASKRRLRIAFKTRWEEGKEAYDQLDTNFKQRNTPSSRLYDISAEMCTIKIQCDNHAEELKKICSGINDIICLSNSLALVRKKCVTTSQKVYTNSCNTLQPLTSQFNDLNKKLDALQFDETEQNIVGSLLITTIKLKESITQKLNENEATLLKIEQIKNDIANKEVYLSEQDLNRKLEEQANLHKDLFKLNDISLSDQIIRLSNQIDRLNSTKLLHQEYKDLIATQVGYNGRLQRLKNLFGPDKQIPDHQVDTKYYHTICNDIFLRINENDALSVLNEENAISLNKINIMLGNCSDLSISNDDFNNQIQEVIGLINTNHTKVRSALLQIESTDENPAIDYFYEENGIQITSSIDPITLTEDIKLRKRYLEVEEYLKTNIKNDHIKRPAFKYKNCGTPQEQHDALINIGKHASKPSSYDNDADEDAVKCKTTLIAACNRQPPLPPFDSGLLNPANVTKKEPGFFQKCKNYLGTIIGSISGALIGGGLGALAGFFLAPVTFGASVPLGAAIGGVIGGMAVGGLAGAGIGYLVDTCIRPYFSKGDEPSHEESDQSAEEQNDKRHNNNPGMGNRGIYNGLDIDPRNSDNGERSVNNSDYNSQNSFARKPTSNNTNIPTDDNKESVDRRRHSYSSPRSI